LVLVTARYTWRGAVVGADAEVVGDQVVGLQCDPVRFGFAGEVIEPG